MKRVLVLVGLLTSCLGWACDDSATETVEPTPDAERAMIEPLDGAVADADLVDGGMAPMGEDMSALNTDDGGAPAVDSALLPDGAAIERPLASEGVLAPVGRITEMEIPENPDLARRSGCLLHGANAGTGPYNLNLVAGGDIFGGLRPDRDGQVAVVLLFRALGWAEGVQTDALDTVTLEFMGGAHSVDGGFTANTSSFVDNDPQGDALVQFEDVALRGGWFEMGPTTLAVPFALFDSPTIPLSLAGVNVTGRLAADGPGMGIDHGVMTGYITLDAMVSVIVSIRAICEADSSAGGCALIGGQLDRSNEDLARLVLSIVGNFDARLEDDVGYPCDPAEEGACNAVGLCLTFGVEGVSLSGVD